MGIEWYQGLIGGLLNIATCTRPEIYYAVRRLARFALDPKEQHEAAALRVLRYSKGTARWGLRFGGKQELAGFCDANCAGDVASRRSTSGYAFLMNGAVVLWSSKLQPTVALSTTDAEYIAAAAAAQNGIWLKLLMLKEGEGDRQVQMKSDSKSVIHFMQDLGGTAPSKHIDVAHNFVPDRVCRGDLVVRYVGTGDIVAHTVTKAVPGKVLSRCGQGLGLVELPKGKGGEHSDDLETKGYGEAEHEGDGDDDHLEGSVDRSDHPVVGHSTWPGAPRLSGRDQLTHRGVRQPARAGLPRSSNAVARSGRLES